MRNIMIPALAIAAALTGPAFAQEAGTDLASELAVYDFATLDADASGGITFDEIATIVSDATEESFAEIDTNEDGMVSQDEFTAYIDAGTMMTTE
ncbi:EF-hand domain-containing protein [Cucumibacter marinus]|uniref:hypothetical protein n=1 Tax=Cucumibacter marinus TaxID=1121252 RepID=UPI00041AB2A1|nr:hypothetical protein [Cucumibacter marinus]